MKNDECTIYIKTKNSVQTWLKDADGWKQISGAGVTRQVTAEQLLSHILPILAGVKTHVTLEVNRDR